MCDDRSRQREQDNAPDNIPTEWMENPVHKMRIDTVEIDGIGKETTCTTTGHAVATIKKLNLKNYHFERLGENKDARVEHLVG